MNILFFQNQTQVLDLGLSHFNDRVNHFMPPQKTEQIYSGTDQPIFF